MAGLVLFLLRDFRPPLRLAPATLLIFCAADFFLLFFLAMIYPLPFEVFLGFLFLVLPAVLFWAPPVPVFFLSFLYAYAISLRTFLVSYHLKHYHLL